MNRPAVWLSCLCSPAGETGRAWLAALGRHGFEARPQAEGELRGPALVLFTGADEGILLHLEALASAGVERVLAVAVAGEEGAGAEAWRLLAAGASDVLGGAGQAELAARAAARLERWTAVDRLLAGPVVAANLVGQSPEWRRALGRLVEVARFSDASVLLNGESGTGKELAARLIHTLDPRPDKGELIILDCTTIVPELSGSEFFGHEKGAFTNALGARDGAFALADGGTLFLDEVGELPPRLQAELLRVVQEGSYKRVGSNRWEQTRFRLVTATHRDLGEEVRQGRFRRDLWYRLATWTCRLPPLARRRGDIPLLARHFLAELFPPGEVPELSGPVRDALLARDYPGNVRDLRQLVQRIGHRHVGDGPITAGDLPEEERPYPAGGNGGGWEPGFGTAIRRALARGVGMKELGERAAAAAVEIALEDEEGNVRRAARRLKISERALQMRRAAQRQGG